MPVSIIIISLSILKLAKPSSEHRVPHRPSRMQESLERYSASRWDVTKSRMPLGCSRRFANHELRMSDIAHQTRRLCLLLPMVQTRRNVMPNFVRVQTMSCSSGSGSTTPQKVDERRGKNLPRPMKTESKPTMVSKGQENYPSRSVCDILGSVIDHQRIYK